MGQGRGRSRGAARRAGLALVAVCAVLSGARGEDAPQKPASTDNHVQRFGHTGWLEIGCADRSPDAWSREGARYDERIAKNPDDLDAVESRGRARLCGDDFQGAMADAEKVLAVHQDAPHALYIRAVARERLGDPKGAIGDFTVLIADNPGPRNYLNRALAYVQANDVPHALADFQSAIAADPRYVDAYNDRATVYADHGDLANALADYDMALQLDPDNLNTLINRGALFIRLGRYDRAIADLDKVLKASPDDPVAHLDRCTARLQAHMEFDKALADCNADLKVRPGHARTLRVRAEVYMNLLRYDEAVADLDASEPIDPRDWSTLEQGCYIRAIANKELDKALGQCTAALSVSKDNPAVLYSRALVSYRLGKYSDAIADLDASLTHSTQANALYLRGLAKHRAGDEAGAKADFDAAAKLSSTMANSFAHYGFTP